MTQTTFTHPSAGQWEEVLAFTDFPILQETREQLRLHLKNPQVSFDDLILVVDRDPALCWHLLQVATQQNPDCRDQLSGALSCLSLLGMQELVRLVKHLKVVAPNSEDEGDRLYRQALTTACLAGNLAAQWAKDKGTCAPGYAQWSTMLAHSVFWPWLLLHGNARNWLHYVSTGYDLIPATEVIFGADSRNWQRLAKRYQLPRMALDLFRHEALPNAHDWQSLRRHDPRDDGKQRALVHQCQTPVMTAMLASSMAWHLHMAPQGRHTERWLAIASHGLGKPLIQVQQDTRRAQVDISHQQNCGLATGLSLLASPQPTRREYPIYALPSLVVQTPIRSVASMAIAEPRITHVSTSNIDPEAKQPTSTKAISAVVPEQPPAKLRKAEAADHGQAFLAKLMRQLQQEPNSFGDWHLLMQGVLKGICRGVGLGHACVMLLDRDRQRLRMVYSENFEAMGALAQVRIPLDSAPLFRQLLKKNACLRLTESNREQYLRGMPTAITELIPLQVSIMSISAGNAPIGIVLACNKQGKGMIKAEQYEAFRQLCTMTSRSLAALSSNTSKQIKPEVTQIVHSSGT
ncbi:HDOD domain-containing protein [Thalassolituus sp.]|uniref:HDOD domain-containing protein n=1 Tax=Thalassolituus sp. TaxID=2030822 RepID=UPI002A8350C1|nr:HDOD domain-containing protein [Thalassolituus sp.]